MNSGSLTSPWKNSIFSPVFSFTIFILGIDGYIGWTLALRLIKKGHQVVGLDSLYTRMRVKEVGSDSVTPIETMQNRIKIVKEKTGENEIWFICSRTRVY